MTLQAIGTIGIPAGTGSSFDHGAFDAKSRRVFVTHTGRDCVEVIDHDTGKHIATLPGFPEAAGLVCEDGQVLVTNRGSASLAWIDAESLETRSVLETGPKPNGVAIVPLQRLAIVASIGNATQGPKLEVLSLDGRQNYSLDLPGRPRWCVTDASAQRVFLAIREPSMILVARLPDLTSVEHWELPSGGAHGVDINHNAHRLYVACDDAALVEVDSSSGRVSKTWAIAGEPDVTFYNPTSGLVHVAIGKPGLVQSIDPRTGAIAQTVTAAGAHTTALVAPDRLYVFSPVHGGSLTFAGA
jgi:DNA-binding beta-propeller fold protein YncE